MEFGAPMKDAFLLDKSLSYLNHGSYGPTPRCVFEQRIKYLYEQESQPDLWFRQKHPKLYEESLAAIAEFLGAKPENLALVDNVTTGVNTIIKSMSFEPGDKIMVNSHTYDAVINVIQEQKDFRGVQIVKVEIPIPIKSEDEIVEFFRREYEKHKTIKMHIVDHISSCSAILFPVKKLMKLAKEYGALSLIDGAHAPGQVEINLEDIGADFYSANLHKWCYVPRSCGFLWFSPRHAGKIRPLVTSHGYKHSLNEQFNHCGTRDFSNAFCIPRALAFLKEIGGMKALHSHADEALNFGCKILTEAFGTEQLEVPDSMKAPYMRLVRLPIDQPARLEIADVWTSEFGAEYQLQACFTVFQDKYWVRFACNVYNDKDDYVKLKDSIVKFLAKGELNIVSLQYKSGKSSP